MGRLKIKVSGGTILETMIALTISVVLFLLVTTLFVNITGRSASVRKVRVQQLLDSCMINTIVEKSFTDGETKSGDFLLRKTIQVVDSIPDLLRIRLIVFDQNDQPLGHQEQLIRHVKN